MHREMSEESSAYKWVSGVEVYMQVIVCFKELFRVGSFSCRTALIAATSSSDTRRSISTG